MIPERTRHKYRVTFRLTNRREKEHGMGEKKMSVRRQDARSKTRGGRGDAAVTPKRAWDRRRAAVVRQLRILLERESAPARTRER